MKSQNKVKGLLLILVVGLAIAVAGPALATQPPFEATINLDPDPATVCTGEIVTIAVEWSTNKDVKSYEWSVDGEGQGAVSFDGASSGSATFDFDAAGMDAGEHELCFHIWHDEQLDRDAEECVTVVVEECGCECKATDSAFAYDEFLGTCFSVYGFSNWGWTIGPLSEGDYTFDMYAGAAQCDTSKGAWVGQLLVSYSEGTATVTYDMDTCRTLKETHLYVGNDVLPEKNDEYTVAPGQYGNTHGDVEDEADQYVITGLSGEIYLIAHAVVCVESDSVSVPVGEE
jgi:hypothetical protein